MKRKLINLIYFLAVMTLLVGLATWEGVAQTSGIKVAKGNNAINYHGGPVMQGSSNVYFIGYGDWPVENESPTVDVLTNFIVGIGSSQYLKINTHYPDSLGNRPSGGVFFGGSVYERSYSHGTELKESDIEGIVGDQIENGSLPLDASGIYIVVATSDISSDSTGFCQSGNAPKHGHFQLFGSQVKYGFVGNPARCPLIEAPQFVGPDGKLLPTPNNDFAGDAMASTVAHHLNVIVTNPLATGWYDRFGFENADKCIGKFGETFVTANGSRANVNFNGRNYLIQQNWINAVIGYCGLSPVGFTETGR